MSLFFHLRFAQLIVSTKKQQPGHHRDVMYGNRHPETSIRQVHSRACHSKDTSQCQKPTIREHLTRGPRMSLKWH